jgi:two-component sensor histidine kinase
MIIFLVASAMSQIYRRHIYFDRAVYRLLIISFSMIILSQMALLFRTTQSLLIIGQLLNILALYYIYRTVTLFVTLQSSNSVFKDIIKRQNSYVLTQETDKTLTNRLLDQNKKLSEQLEKNKVFEKKLIENEKNYRILASHIPNSAVYLFDKDLKIILAEGSEISATGYKKNDFEGKYMHEFFSHGGKQKLLPKYTKVLMGMSFIEDYTYHDKIYRIRSAPLVGEQDNIYGGVALVQNIEHEKKLENKLETIIAEKEVLLQESYHRIDNNLQIISSIIDLTLMRIEHESSREMLADARDKIQSMALVHRQLTTSKDFKTIDISKHLGDLAEYLRTIYASENNISLDVDIDSFRMSIDQVIPLSLIVNELVSNAYKHAFQRQKKGKISLNVSKSGDKVILWVNDTGDNHGLATRASQNRMGLKLVHTLVSRQLKGNMDITNNKGSKIKIEFQYK